MAELSLGIRSCGDGAEAKEMDPSLADENKLLDISRLYFENSDVESNSDYGSADLDEAFVDTDLSTRHIFDEWETSDNDEDEDESDEMNMCHLEETMIEKILNSSFCESDEGCGSIGSDI